MKYIGICIFVILSWVGSLTSLPEQVFDSEPPQPPYEATWKSLDSRPLPQWYDDVKFGIFLHWGLYSVPSYSSEWFWANWNGKDKNIEKFMKDNYPPGFTYQSFAPEFKAEFFNATQWANILENSGAKYVVLTSKHHEGFTLWPSSKSFSWNSVDVGPRRDIVGELSKAIKDKNGMHFGVYYSLYEWFNPIYLQDKAQLFLKQEYVDQKMLPDLHELVNNYKPDIIWTDGDWEAPDKYFRSEEFLSWLFNESPVKDSVVVNDRWGMDIPCHHGGVYTCTDRFNPHVLQKHKWENCMTVDKHSWGYRRNAEISDFLTVENLISELVTTVSCGGNLLMNVGPTKEGTIAPIFQDRLDGIGKWLKVNGEAIYKTAPWIHQNDTINGNVWYTSTKEPTGYIEYFRLRIDNVYAIMLEWPEDNILKLGGLVGKIEDRSKVTMLGYNGDLKWTKNKEAFTLQLPNMADINTTGAWCLKITYVLSDMSQH